MSYKETKYIYRLTHVEETYTNTIKKKGLTIFSDEERIRFIVSETNNETKLRLSR